MRLVVKRPWPLGGPQDPQFCHPGMQRGRPHGVGVVGMQQRRQLGALADRLKNAGRTDQIRCNGWVFSLSDIRQDPGAPHADHQVEVQSHNSQVMGRYVMSRLQTWFGPGAVSRGTEHGSCVGLWSRRVRACPLVCRTRYKLRSKPK